MTEERKEKILDAIKSIEDLSEFEWGLLKQVVDRLFWGKKRELEKTLKLPSEKAEAVIRDIFG